MNGKAPCITSGHKLAYNLEGLLLSVDKTYRNIVTAVQSLHILGFSLQVYYFSISGMANKRKENCLLIIHVEKLILLQSSLPAFKFSLHMCKFIIFSLVM